MMHDTVSRISIRYTALSLNERCFFGVKWVKDDIKRDFFSFHGYRNTGEKIEVS